MSMTEETNRQVEGAQQAPQKPQRKIPRVEQAAILLMSLGETDAAEVLKHMGPKEVQRVGVAMAQMKDVSKDDVRAEPVCRCRGWPDRSWRWQR